MALALLRARARWRNTSGPRVLVNSLPKAGTHLVTRLFDEHPGIDNAYVHLRNERFGGGLAGGEFRPDLARLSALVSTVPEGHFFTAHMPYSTGVSGLLAEQGIRIINVIRDPRDLLLSRLRYVVGLKRHYLHPFITRVEGGDRARLLALLAGCEDADAEARFTPYPVLLDRFAGWRTDTNVMTVKFEQLVGERGGGSAQTQTDVLQAMFGFAGLEADLPVCEGIVRNASGSTGPTFRRGQTGAWKDELGAELGAEITERLKQPIEAMGYSAESC